MKTRVVLLAGMLLAIAAFAGTPKKTTSKTAKVTKPKTSTTKTPSNSIPVDAYVFKDNNNREAKITEAHKTIVIEGDGNKIEIGEGNEQIFIKGKNNDINMKRADYIEITGDGNFVSWESTMNPNGKPVIVDKGGYNNVGKRSGSALNKSDN